MSRVIEAFAQFFDGNGDPLVDGWLAFLESGSNNTYKNTYSDVGEEIANTNPVQLDAEGRLGDVFGTGSYRVILYTNDELLNQPATQIDQFDPVGGQDARVDFSDWNSTSIYSEGSIVTGSDGNYYRSLTNNNSNNDPSTGASEWEPIEFVQFYQTNRDYIVGSKALGSDYRWYSATIANGPSSTVVNPVGDSTGTWLDMFGQFYQINRDYIVGDFSTGSDKIQYQAIIANGPSSTVVDPVGDDTGTWEKVSDVLTFTKSFISGLVLSNATDTDHDITISPGRAVDSTDLVNLILDTAITKQIDAVWAPGDNAGGLLNGSVAVDTKYPVLIFKKDSDGSIDAGFGDPGDIPSGYTEYRRVGSVETDGSAELLQFTAVELAGGSVHVEWKVMQLDVSGSTSTIRNTPTVSAPPNSIAIIDVRTTGGSAVDYWVKSVEFTDIAPTSSISNGVNDSGQNGMSNLLVPVSIDSEIAYRFNAAVTVNLNTSGWIDRRIS